MIEKIGALGLYALVGILLALAPLLPFAPGFRRPRALSEPRWGALLAAASLLASAWVLLFAQSLSNAMAPALLLGLVAAFVCPPTTGLHGAERSDLDRFQSASAFLLAALVSGLLAWWRRPPYSQHLLLGESALIIAIWAVATLVLLRRPVPVTIGPRACASASGSSASGSSASGSLNTLTSRRGYAGVLLPALFVIAAVYFSFSLAVFSRHEISMPLWHHWSAYIGPAELLREGVRLLHDIPVQYGVGPTVALALACGNDCWAGAYGFFGLSILAHALLVGALAWSCRSGDRWRDALMLVCVLAALFFWTAFPPWASSPLGSPSVSGVRGLPAEVLVAWIVFSQPVHALFRNVVGHLLWLACLVWAPEAGFQATLIWGGIYLFDSRQPGSWQSQWALLARSAARLVLIAAVFTGLVLAACATAFGVLPDPDFVIAYLKSPPGVTTGAASDSGGAVLFFLLALALGVWNAWRRWSYSGDAERFRKSLAIHLLAWAAFSYWLGRSSDNNILNLMPATVLVLIDALERPMRIAVRQAGSVLLAAVLAWMVVFGWDAWGIAWRSGNMLDTDIARLDARFSYRDMTPDMAEGIRVWSAAETVPQFDGAADLMRIITARGESFTIIDGLQAIDRTQKQPPWTGWYGPANFAPLPPDVREEAMRRVARRLHRPGWVIVRRDSDYPPRLASFERVYRETERLEREQYFAIRFEPRD
jgi:hypothetical protein